MVDSGPRGFMTMDHLIEAQRRSNQERIIAIEFSSRALTLWQPTKKYLSLLHRKDALAQSIHDSAKCSGKQAINLSVSEGLSMSCSRRQ